MAESRYRRLIERLSDNTLRVTLHGYHVTNTDNNEKNKTFNLTVDGRPVDQVLQVLYDELDLEQGDLLKLSISVRRTRWKRRRKRNGSSLDNKPKPRSREQLLEWLCSTWTAYYIGPADGWVFMKHIMIKPSVIFQVILSGNMLQDGVYRLLKFDLYDQRQPDGTYQPVLVLKDDDFLDLATSNNPSSLRRQLIIHGFLSKEEFDTYFEANEQKQAALAEKLPKLVIRT